MTVSPRDPTPAAPRSPARWTAASASMLAALVHVAAASEHAAWWPAAVFFSAVAAGQLLLAGYVLRGRRTGVLCAGMLGTVLVLGTYVASRTVGLPLVPTEHGGDRPVPGGQGSGVPVLPGRLAPGVEAVGALDLVALAAELVVVLLLVGMLPARARTVAVNGIFVLGAGAWIGWAVGPLV